MGFFGMLASLFTKVLALIRKYRKKVNNKQDENRSKWLDIISNIGLVVSTVWLFMITLPIILQVLIYAMILLAVLAAVLMLLSSVSDTMLEDNKEYESNYTGNGAYVASSDFLAFNKEELDMYGTTLSDYEKNLYRLGIVFNDAFEGYGDTKYFEGEDRKTLVTFALGISSIETSMQFFEDSKRHDDILTTPSDKPLNSSGFGVLGLCGKVGDCYTSQGKLASKRKHLGALTNDASASLVSKYPLAQEPTPSVNYYPYSAFYTVQHLNTKAEVAKKYLDEAMAVFEEWGIKANMEEHRTVVYNLMTQAGFHGVFYSDIEYYANFWAALLHATSEIDEERSFYKWSIPQNSKAGYDESNIRKAFNGTTGCKNYPANADPSTWKGKGTEISINGIVLDVPVWAYLDSKYSGQAGWESAVKKTYEWGSQCAAAGAGAHTLNFHYGFNSFLQGNRVVIMLREKMPIPKNASATANFDSLLVGGQVNKEGLVRQGKKIRPNAIQAGAKGQAQGSITVNGKTQTTASYLADFYSKKYRNYYAKLSPHMGTTSYYTDSNHYGKRADYESFNFFGVPFYPQVTATAGKGGDSYNSLYYGADSDATFSWAGCMVYATSYVATALTGKLINPAEMALIHTARGGLSQGTSMSSDGMHGKVMGELTGGSVKHKHWANTLDHPSLMLAVTKELQKGNAMAVIRLGTPYASGINHYVVLTGAVLMENGEFMYTMYSSSNIQHSTTLHSLKDLARKGGNRRMATVFYYK